MSVPSSFRLPAHSLKLLCRLSVEASRPRARSTQGTSSAGGSVLSPDRRERGAPSSWGDVEREAGARGGVRSRGAGVLPTGRAPEAGPGGRGVGPSSVTRWWCVSRPVMSLLRGLVRRDGWRDGSCEWRRGRTGEAPGCRGWTGWAAFARGWRVGRTAPQAPGRASVQGPDAGARHPGGILAAW